MKHFLILFLAFPFISHSQTESLKIFANSCEWTPLNEKVFQGGEELALTVTGNWSLNGEVFPYYGKALNDNRYECQNCNSMALLIRLVDGIDSRVISINKKGNFKHKFNSNNSRIYFKANAGVDCKNADGFVNVNLFYENTKEIKTSSIEVTKDFQNNNFKKQRMFVEFQYVEIKDLLKQFLTLISASLVLSITFSDKIIQFSTAGARQKNLLYACWIVLIFSLILCGLGLYNNYMAAERALNEINGFSQNSFTLVANKAYFLQDLSGIFYVISMILLVLSTINFKKPTANNA